MQASNGAANPDTPVPYEFRQEIARGGMGSILEAEDRYAGEQTAEEFWKEFDAKTAAQKKP